MCSTRVLKEFLNSGDLKHYGDIINDVNDDKIELQHFYVF